MPTSATTKASRIHANTSTTAAALSESWPKGVRVMPRSFRMRAITGKAVIDSAAAMNSAKGQKPTPAGASVGCSAGEIARPSTSGTSTLSTPTAPAACSCARMLRVARSSRPTTNMNSTSPTVASDDSPCSDSLANNCACSDGNSRPMTAGPSINPAAISPTTLGCPTWRSTQPHRRAVVRMTTSCSSRVVTDMAGSR